MISSDYFERLVTSVERIARHTYYPGINEAIDQCLEDIDELMHAGSITPDEREALRIVLLGMTLTASNNTSNAA
jgi:hypothetical protein